MVRIFDYISVLKFIKVLLFKFYNDVIDFCKVQKDDINS